MKKVLTWCCTSLMALLLVACGGEDSGAPSQPDQGTGGTPPTSSIVSLQVTPIHSRIPAGFEQQFIAEATMSDGSVQDVTQDSRLGWSSSDTAIATINAKGLAKGMVAGVVTITAAGTTAEGKLVSATAQLEVTDAHVTTLQVTPATASVPVGLEQQYIATAIFSDNSTLDVTGFSGLSWSSDNATIASVDNADRKGEAMGLAVGTSTITASGTANGVTFSATAELIVTDAVVTGLQVTPDTATVPVGLEQHFIAHALLSDGTTRDVTNHPALQWSSNNEAITTVSNLDGSKGVATGITVGNATITATGAIQRTTLSATAALTVTNAVVTALEVTPVQTEVVAGLEKQFLATATLSDGSTRNVTDYASLTWSSSDSAIATVSSLAGSKGLATGVTTGVVTITASGIANGTQFSDTAELTVTDALASSLQITPATALVARGLTQQYTAILTFTDGSVQDVTDQAALSWSSSDPAIATISSTGTDKGLATGVIAGDVIITASGITQGVTLNATALLTVTNAGTLVTWGNASSGGDSSAVHSRLTNVRTVASSGDGIFYDAFAALKQDGTVVTWGNSSTGGDSTSVESLLVDVNSITGNVGAFAALRQDGSVVTWGSSDWGGDSSNVQAQLIDVQKIYSSSHAFAVLKQDGSVVSWGSYGNGGFRPPILVSAELINVKDVSTTGQSYAALKQDGSVVTWGNFDTGAIINDQLQSQLVNVQKIYSTGYAFAALIQDGSVIAWGDPNSGGNSSSVSLTNVREIFSTTTAFAALNQDGSVVTWGDVNNGGNSSSVQPLTDVQTIFSSGSAFAALKSDGTVVTWGNPNAGGDSSSVQPLTDVQTIFSSASAFAAVKSDGTVVTWGDPNGGGNSASVQPLADVRDISNTDTAFAALKPDGSVVTWGNPSTGGDSVSVQPQLVNVQTIFSNHRAFAALIGEP